MSDTPISSEFLAQTLDRQLRQNGGEYERVDVVPLRLQTLEQALREFDGDEDAAGMERYLVQLTPSRKTQAPNAEANAAEAGEIYLNDGTLNVPYLMKNAELLAHCREWALARNIYQRIAQPGRPGQSANHTALALSRIAACFEAEDRPDEARRHYEQSIAFHPTIETYRDLSSLLMRQKKDRPAAEALERAQNLKELSPRLRFELLKAAGNCWMRSGEMPQAERAYKKALAIEPAADEIQANLGALYLMAGKLTEAFRKFQDTLACNPRNDQAISGLGMCLLQQKNPREAHDHFARALEIRLNNPTALYHLVKCAFELKSYVTAARITENYIEIAPISIHLLYSLAGMQFHLGRTDSARATARRIIEMSPTHSGAKDLLQRIENFSCHGRLGGQGHDGN